MKKTLTRDGRHVFTPIELLVVVSIIAILASILLPALSRARAKATQITCVSQLKQIGMAFVDYETDEADPPIGGSRFGSGVWTNGWFYNYDKGGIRDTFSPNVSSVADVSKVLYCPSYLVESGKTTSAGYCFNRLMRPYTDPKFYLFLKANRVEDPSRSVIMLDRYSPERKQAAGGSGFWYYITGGGISNWDNFPLRSAHKTEASTFLLWDGHVEIVSQLDLVPATSTNLINGTSAYGERFVWYSGF